LRPRKKKFVTIERDGKKVLFCEKCNVDVTKGMFHCKDCDVCIHGWDHHCIFFSKCIGGGNFMYFSGALGMLIVNFAIIFAIIFFEDLDKNFSGLNDAKK
jgi:hypothetical protein